MSDGHEVHSGLTEGQEFRLQQEIENGGYISISDAPLLPKSLRIRIAKGIWGL
jgi:hypothetical protein